MDQIARIVETLEALATNAKRQAEHAQGNQYQAYAQGQADAYAEAAALLKLL